MTSVQMIERGDRMMDEGTASLDNIARMVEEGNRVAD